MCTNSLTHSQAAQPYSNTHVIQNFLEPPSHLQIVPTYYTKQLCEGGQRAAALFCCGPGLAERGAGRRLLKRREVVASVLPGFVIKRYATLHLKCVGFVSFLYFPQNSLFLQTWQLNFWLCARILTCSLYWMDTWLTGQQAQRTGAAHCEPPESAASPPHQCFLKAYSHIASVPHSLLRSDRATSCSSADRSRIHLHWHTYCECLINST